MNYYCTLLNNVSHIANTAYYTWLDKGILDKTDIIKYRADEYNVIFKWNPILWDKIKCEPCHLNCRREVAPRAQSLVGCFAQMSLLCDTLNEFSRNTSIIASFSNPIFSFFCIIASVFTLHKHKPILSFRFWTNISIWASFS